MPAPVILSPREAAALLNVAESTLKAWRAKGVGPLWVRRAVRLVGYRRSDLEAWLAGLKP